MMEGSTMTPTLTALLCLGLCWGLWDQVQAGILPKPSIWAEPGHMITTGSRVTIWCEGSLQAELYVLYKDNSSEPLDTRPPQDSSSKTGFLIANITSHNAGLYQCAYYITGNKESEQSDSLRLVFTGWYAKPSLSAQPGPSVSWGENVTLQCGSVMGFDTFHLHREGSLDPPQLLHLQGTSAPSQATFIFSTVTSGHSGTYRCYSSRSASPYLLSHPSDPLELVVSGLPLYLNILIVVSVALLLLLCLLLFLLFRRQHQDKGRRSDAALKDPQPKKSMELDPQAAASDASQDVTYAQLNQVTLRRETTAPPSSPSEEPPEESSIYAALAIH